MKKLLGILVLGLLLSGNAYAKCLDDLKFSWSKTEDKGNLKYYNSGLRYIRITKYLFVDAEGNTIIEATASGLNFSSGTRFYKGFSKDVFTEMHVVGPNETKNYSVYSDRMKHAKRIRWFCKYGK